MKYIRKLLVVFSIMTMMFTTLGCNAKKEDEENVGGWTVVEDGTITGDLQKLFDKAMENQVGVDYELIKLLETQVVSGTNYKFLCGSKVASPDAETKQVIITIYEDLNGNIEILNIEDVESDNIQIPNPFITVDTINEAEEGAGFSFAAPETIEGYNGKDISYIEDKMIQIIYGDEENNIYLRKAKGNEDISGDYNEYAKVEEITISESNITIKANEDGIHTATWNIDNYSYALQASKGLEQELVESLISVIK